MLCDSQDRQRGTSFEQAGIHRARSMGSLGGPGGRVPPGAPSPGAVSGVVRNQPIVFHRNIKSSGYGATPPVMKLGVLVCV